MEKYKYINLELALSLLAKHRCSWARLIERIGLSETQSPFVCRIAECGKRAVHVPAALSPGCTEFFLCANHYQNSTIDHHDHESPAQ